MSYAEIKQNYDHVVDLRRDDGGYLDKNGVAILWDAIKKTFVTKEDYTLNTQIVADYVRIQDFVDNQLDNKFLDEQGVQTLWNLIQDTFVKKNEALTAFDVKTLINEIPVISANNPGSEPGLLDASYVQMLRHIIYQYQQRLKKMSSVCYMTKIYTLNAGSLKEYQISSAEDLESLFSTASLCVTDVDGNVIDISSLPTGAVVNIPSNIDNDIYSGMSYILIRDKYNRPHWDSMGQVDIAYTDTEIKQCLNKLFTSMQKQVKW